MSLKACHGCTSVSKCDCSGVKGEKVNIPFFFTCQTSTQTTEPYANFR